MAFAVGTIIFVVVVFGGMGSLPGAFVASLLIGSIQTFSVALDYSFVNLLQVLGFEIYKDSSFYGLASITLSQLAPVLPYLMLVLMLIFRPSGLMGKRET